MAGGSPLARGVRIFRFFAEEILMRRIPRFLSAALIGCGVVTGPSMRFCGGDEPDCRAAIVSRRGEMTADAVRGGRADP